MVEVKEYDNMEIWLKAFGVRMAFLLFTSIVS